MGGAEGYIIVIIYYYIEIISMVYITVIHSRITLITAKAEVRADNTRFRIVRTIHIQDFPTSRLDSSTIEEPLRQFYTYRETHNSLILQRGCIRTDASASSETPQGTFKEMEQNIKA